MLILADTGSGTDTDEATAAATWGGGGGDGDRLAGLPVVVPGVVAVLDVVVALDVAMP
jgi:hypothetical protein